MELEGLHRLEDFAGFDEWALSAAVKSGVVAKVTVPSTQFKN